MPRPDTVESKRLAMAMHILDEACSAADDTACARLSILESVACARSGIRLDDYREITGYETAQADNTDCVNALVETITASGVPFALALSSLARIETTEIETKKNGAVYTDFRLAAYLADNVMNSYSGGAIIDLACGTSIILAACAQAWASRHGDASELVSTSIYGVDLSGLAVRGSLLVLSTFLRKTHELELLCAHFIVGDSLILGNEIQGRFDVNNFSLVVGNPPWERIRPSRYEHARECGLVVNYGTEIKSIPSGYEKHRDESKARSAQLAKEYGLKGGMDLYRVFLSLSMKICCNGGTVALYLPAGLIRSKSLSDARCSIMREFDTVVLSVFMNRSRFFAIDSRFKFVLANLQRKTNDIKPHAMGLKYCSASDRAVEVSSELNLNNSLLNNVSAELGVPEVKTADEVRVLETIWKHGCQMRQHHTFSYARPIRELDMTLDRNLFIRTNERNIIDRLPLIEGRMISQYRCGSKEYITGSGRSAKWEVVPPGANKVSPQYVIDGSMLDRDLASRVKTNRIGFCDIAGQTNERAMQAAFIPAGCVCGNKVPTLLFHNNDEALLWLGIANSFVFDWVVRRYITTTINFFILENLPLPEMPSGSDIAKSIIAHTREACFLMSGSGHWTDEDAWIFATERAKIDALVFRAYGLLEDDLDIVLSDFPLVDRINARVCGGIRPTIELVRAHITGDSTHMANAKLAFKQGALPYVPNEHMRKLNR